MTKNQFCRKCGRKHNAKVTTCDEVSFMDTDAAVEAVEAYRTGGVAALEPSDPTGIDCHEAHEGIDS